MNQQLKRIPSLDPHCFGCGHDNEQGLKMEFHTDDIRLYSEVDVPSHLRGWSNLVHGGVLSSILDEMMAWSAIYLLRRFILTKDLKVQFLRPVYVEKSLRVEGEILKKIDDRNAVMCARIYNEDNKLCAKAEGNFVLFTKEEFQKKKLMPEELLEHMASVFES